MPTAGQISPALAVLPPHSAEGVDSATHAVRGRWQVGGVADEVTGGPVVTASVQTRPSEEKAEPRAAGGGAPDRSTTGRAHPVVVPAGGDRSAPRVAGLVRAGGVAPAARVHRVRRGTYVPSAVWDAAPDDERYRLRAVAAAHASDGAAAVLSHWSAAVVHGLPLVGRRDDRVHVVRGPASGGRSEGEVARHTYDDPVHPVVVDGVRATPVARTIVDLARLAGVMPGVVAGDHAVREGLTTVGDLAREVAAVRPGGRGVRAARDVVAWVDARSESPGESLSRVRMAEAGLSRPVLQHVVRDARGDIGRVDFWWEDVQVVGEFDGRLKYRVADPATDAVEDVVWREKLREDRLRATGARVVRWTWQDAWQGDPLIRLLLAAGVR